MSVVAPDFPSPFTRDELHGQGTVALVACVQQKAPEARPAADLYCSNWFKWAREVVERQGWPWRILSARHGLLHPARVIAPYQQALMQLSSAERAVWAARVLADLADLPPLRVVVLAGSVYRAGLVPTLERRGCMIEVPMAGMGVGYQRQWLTRQLAALRAQGSLRA